MTATRAPSAVSKQKPQPIPTPQPPPPHAQTKTRFAAHSRLVSSPAQPPRFQRFERVGLVSASALVALNIWTGCPLLALWIGSRLVGGDGLSMGAVFVVVIALSALELAMTIALTWMSTRYDERIARRFDQRRSSPWLRSMRGEREELIKGRLGVTPIEWVMMISVALAVITLETWFFFFAGSPLVG